MIGRLRGTLLERQPGSILLDVGGVGYEAAVSLHTFSSLPPVGSTASVEVVTVLRENALELFAFADLAEKQAFALLRTVSGIGPRMAIAVLSGIRVEELARAVADEDARRTLRVTGDQLLEEWYCRILRRLHAEDELDARTVQAETRGQCAPLDIVETADGPNECHRRP